MPAEGIVGVKGLQVFKLVKIDGMSMPSNFQRDTASSSFKGDLVQIKVDAAILIIRLCATDRLAQRLTSGRRC